MSVAGKQHFMHYHQSVAGKQHFMHYHQSVALVHNSIVYRSVVAAVWKPSQYLSKSRNFGSIVAVLALLCVSALLCP